MGLFAHSRTSRRRLCEILRIFRAQQKSVRNLIQQLALVQYIAFNLIIRAAMAAHYKRASEASDTLLRAKKTHGRVLVRFDCLILIV